MSILVTTNSNPDLDGISSALGYADFLTATGKEAVAGFEGEYQLDAQFILDRLAFRPLPMPTQFDSIVLVNANTSTAVPGIVRKNIDLVSEVVDHRLYQDIESEFPSVEKVDVQQVGACATIITEHWSRCPTRPSKLITTLLYTAIYSNTLDLKAGVTTANDRKAVELLTSWHPISRDIVDEMFQFRTNLSSDQVEFALKNDFKGPFRVADGRLGIAQIEMLDGSALLSHHQELIYRVLNELKVQFKLDYIFLTVPCISQQMNYLYTVDRDSASLLKKYMTEYLGASPSSQANGFLVQTNKLLLRKEIMPMFEKFPL